MHNTKLSISIVTHHSDLNIFKQSIQSLEASINRAFQSQKISQLELYFIDNSLNKDYSNQLKQQIKAIFKDTLEIKLKILTENKGYGHAHNLSLTNIDSNYHIIMNPDVIIDHQAICLAIDYMQNNLDVGLISPYAETENKDKLYLLKRYPQVLILFIRGFLPALCAKSFFKKSADYYELRDIDQTKEFKDVQIASGCFMFFRTENLKNKFSFSEKFFLYFEDYDLTWQFSMNYKIAYVPSVRIIHYGGYAAKKGLKHVYYFIRSSITFFNRFGWKFI